MTAIRDIREATRRYILHNVLLDDDVGNLDASTPLTSGGILDSIATIKLVRFLEETYGVEFEARELSEEYLDTLDSIAELVLAKLQAVERAASSAG